MTDTLNTPTPAIRRVLCEVARDDRQWFANHPGRAMRTRRFITGEAWPLSPQTDRVTVAWPPGEVHSERVVRACTGGEMWSQIDYDLLLNADRERVALNHLLRRREECDRIKATIDERGGLAILREYARRGGWRPQEGDER